MKIIAAYERHAETKMALLTGGMAIPHRQNLFCISGWAKDMEVAGKRAQQPLNASSFHSAYWNTPNLPYATTAIGSLGHGNKRRR